MRAWTNIVIAAAMVAAPLHAQAAPPEPAPGTIEVRGKRQIDKAIVADSIRALTRRIKVLDVVPRFHDPVCLQVTGPDMAANRVIAERITAAAELTGLDKPNDNCRVNALLVIVDDPERLLDKLVQRHRPVIGGLERDVHMRRLRDDVAAGKPVISWNRVLPIKPGTINMINGTTAESRSLFTSRLEGRMYRSKVLSVVVFDSRQTGGATPAQIGDYAALHLLANPNRNIDFNVPAGRSILSLFADGPDLAPEGLTAFDRAYLEGVYAVGANAWRGKVTRAVLAAYEEECADEKPDCQFLVAEEGQ